MKHVLKVVVAFCVMAVVFASAFVFSGCSADAQPTLGTWWWYDGLNAEKYLNFASENGVTEIYFCTSKFNNSTQNFISLANSKNIDVYWLAGEHEWLIDSSKLINQINNYINYQNSHKSAQFKGVHLDIEPHQREDFNTNRAQLIYNLIDLASTLKTQYPTVKFDYDLPFWLDDEITYNNQTKPAYCFMIDTAHRVFVMSYRDTAEGILKIAKEEISYAKEQNKQLVLCVETNSTEGDNVSFKEEGKRVMQQELDKLKKQIPSNFGTAIHNIKTWYDLHD